MAPAPNHPDASETGQPSAGSYALDPEERAYDMELVRRAKGGDRDAFQELYERHRHKVYRVAVGMTRNQEDALDVVQDTFVKAHRSLERFEGRSSIGTWLCQIATHRAIDMGRRQKVRRADPLEEGAVPGTKAGAAPVEKAQAEELREKLEEALGQLSEKHRTVFVLYTVKGMSYKEIASTLEISIGTVMSRLFYARKNLQSLLAEFAPQ
ncbi:MAG: RNA polymerase sigma factor [Planctomycetota bacterium]